MALGWALKRMSDQQYWQMLEQMNEHVKRNFTIMKTIRDELLPNEDLLTFIEAQDGTKGGSCVLVLTDQRLFVAEKHWRGRFELEVFPFDEVLFGGYRHTRMYSRFDIWHGQIERHFNSTNRERMDAFAQHFIDKFDYWYERSAHRKDVERDETTDQKNQAPDSLQLDKLERLVELWQSGALDDAEFQLAKRRLLS